EVEAAMIYPPHYYDTFPKSINYGAMGAVIGHEITHGFDPTGSQFNHIGKLRNWWSNETREEFDRRVQCIVDQYSNETVVPELGIQLNGMQTKEENVADLGGLKAAFRVFLVFLS
ncbi:hypothetical protein PFISCL1PPCAC_26791, partial [Pristionchus fissidentatus]